MKINCGESKIQKLIGSPITVKFEKPLTKKTYDYWVARIFGCNDNPFELWGNPIVLGPKKIHVYGIDKHLWEPIWLELTDKGIIVIMPNGICENTIYRLICNIQRYIDPEVKAYIGTSTWVLERKLSTEKL